MQVTFYGVRGSMPAAGSEFTRYGGNTACVHILLSDGTDLILDAGTGIVKLGDKLIANKKQAIHLLLTHNHWDHIQGFPFFTPAYQMGRPLYITPGLTNPEQHNAILEQMSGSWFPIPYQNLKADIQLTALDADVTNWTIGSCTISRTGINHPGGGSAYLIEDAGKRLAYVTDNELYPPYPATTSYEQWLEFLADVDLLIHDAQYIKKDMPLKHGWGHSLIGQAVNLACEAKVKSCALYSHDYTRTDDDIDNQINDIRAGLMKQGMSLNVFAAAEGMTIRLSDND